MAYSAEESSPIAYISESCCVCDEEFSSDSDLTSHLINHANDEFFKSRLQELEKKCAAKNSNSNLNSTPLTTKTTSGREQPLKRTASQRASSPEVWEIISDDSDDENNKNQKSPRLSNSFRLKRRPPKKRKPPPCFTQEIQYMMHSLGDCIEPDWGSVIYMEKILRQQLDLLMVKASDVAGICGESSIDFRHLLFLLRKNKVKLKRLLLYLSVRDAKDILTKANSSETPDLVYSPSHGPRVKSCLEFLSTIDNIYMYEDIMDENIEDVAVQRRNQRRFAMVCDMNDEEYLDFFEKQQTSFCPKGNCEKFLKWLEEISSTKMAPTSFATEIINYLAKETIAEVIDLVMQLRLQHQNGLQENDCQTSIQQTKDSSDVKTNMDFSNTPAMEMDSLIKSIVNKAITVSEIEETIRLSVKTAMWNSTSNKQEFVKEPLPDHLLCC